MKQGERYILLFTAAPRMQPAALGVPAYAVTGGWAGLFQIVNNALQLSPAAQPSLRTRYEGKNPDVLLTDLGSVSP